MKNLIIIPPKPPESKKLKVAAYCRVSTLSPTQRRSLDWQIKSYTKIISEHPDWIFAGVFYDAGKSGLRRSGRTGLDKMLKKAANGKIDYIITKAISRLSRDTVEVLKIVRYLRERSINMYFENENLDFIRLDKEFEITLRCMLAQDESRNTSENIQWGFQRKFEKVISLQSIKILWSIPVLMMKSPLFQSRRRSSERYLTCIYRAYHLGR